MGVYKMNKFLNLHINAATPKQSFVKLYSHVILQTTGFLMFIAFVLFLLVGCA